ncbi:MAG: RtcB family protein [Christensenellales bacterium]|jgi:RNA-splicing ligase RtcB
MIEIKGRYNTIKVFADELEDSARRDIEAMCNLEFLEGAKIRIMPDVHAGKGCTIGTTMTIKDKVVPNFVGVDIGCGMEVSRLKQKSIDFEKLDALIRNTIPAGMRVRKTLHPYVDEIRVDDLRCKNYVNLERARYSVGTLGGGNHFIEVDKDEKGTLYLVVHSGSRHLGTQVCEYYQDLGFSKYQDRVKEYKLSQLPIARAHWKRGETYEIKIPFEMSKNVAYVDGQNFEDYIHDMKITQEFAVLNRQAMVDEIVKGLNLDVVEQFTTIHNYIDTDDMILRKGAVSAKKGEKFIIPINMRDGALICIGKGNEDWNYSGPHGAGRLCSRTKATKTFSMSEYRDSMEGIFSTCINRGTLDESPQAYKPIDDIIKHIKDTATIKKQIKPIYNFKCSD